jgi:hypothetical protein
LLSSKGRATVELPANSCMPEALCMNLAGLKKVCARALQHMRDSAAPDEEERFVPIHGFAWYSFLSASTRRVVYNSALAVGRAGERGIVPRLTHADPRTYETQERAETCIREFTTRESRISCCRG